MRTANLIIGVILVIVGSLLLLGSVDVVEFGLFDFWPVILIFIGLVILLIRPRKQPLIDPTLKKELNDDTK